MDENKSELIKYAEKLYAPDCAKGYIEECLDDEMSAESIKDSIDAHIEMCEEFDAADDRDRLIELVKRDLKLVDDPTEYVDRHLNSGMDVEEIKVGIEKLKKLSE